MGIALKTIATPIEGVVVVETTPVSDHRGVFARLFCSDELRHVIGSRHIVQINCSRTIAVGAVRGMHYQAPPHAETKFVTCLRGRVWDVAVDLRAGSNTFLRWHGEELSPANRRTLVIPEGCAHGFQALEENSELLYLHTEFYMPSSEDGVQPTDPLLKISWPLPVADLSARDRNHPLLTSVFSGLRV